MNIVKALIVVEHEGRAFVVDYNEQTLHGEGVPEIYGPEFRKTTADFLRRHARWANKRADRYAPKPDYRVAYYRVYLKLKKKYGAVYQAWLVSKQESKAEGIVVAPPINLFALETACQRAWTLANQTYKIDDFITYFIHCRT